MARVAIVIPLFNAERFVREAIESVRSQTHADWELLVVDDGSTDRSHYEAAAAADGDTRIRIVRQANKGVSAARNHGVGLSRGEYLAFLDADDVWHPKNLSAKLVALESRADCALAHSDAAVIDAVSRRTSQLKTGSDGWILEQSLLWRGDPVPALPSNAVLRRRTFDEVGGFDTDLSTAADQDLKFRIAERWPVARVPEALVLYRVHGANMHTNVLLMERDHSLAYTKARARGSFRSEAFRRRCFANLYGILAGSLWHGGHRWRALKYGARAIALRPDEAGRVVQRAASAVLDLGR